MELLNIKGDFMKRIVVKREKTTKEMVSRVEENVTYVSFGERHIYTDITDVPIFFGTSPETRNLEFREEEPKKCHLKLVKE